MPLPSEIRERRHAPDGNVSQAELASALGRSQTWVGMIERGVIPADASMIEPAPGAVDRIRTRKKVIAKAKLAATLFRTSSGTRI
jgi:predicted transcriptional regulator